jgi:membrane protease YdiL (CAAX protease family)
MVAGALGIRLFAAQQSAALFGGAQADIDRLLQLPPGLQDVQQVGVLLGAAATVTAARLLLLQRWPEFAASTEASNQQVLGPLQGYPDAALIALLSGVSEELLFRGALVPATWPDARGVLAAGALFGLLHVSGGRNFAYAAWASAVGWLYGAAFLATGNVWVPAGAHAAANFASAALWLSRQQQGQQQGGEQLVEKQQGQSPQEQQQQQL